MKIVVLDALTLGTDIDLERFRELGEVVIYSTSTPEEALDRLREADVAIVNKVPMNEDTLRSAPALRMLALTATGYNNVDFQYISTRNITVANAAGYSTQSVVQHTFAMLFYIMEQLKYYDQYVKSGEYSKSPVFSHFDRVFPEIWGKTWGIIGLGNIGQQVASVAKAFGCNVIYFSTSGRNQNDLYKKVEFDQLLELSDIISVHAPLNSVTENMMNYEAFRKMKKSAYFLNLGRGPIVNESDLAKALKDDEIAGAALDVICREPITADNPLNDIKDSGKLLITPHIAWATHEARVRLMDEVYENIKAFIKGEKRNIIGGR